MLTLNDSTQVKDDFRVLCEMIFFNRIKNDYYIINSKKKDIKIWNNKGVNINSIDGTIFLNKYYYNFKYYLLYGGDSSKVEIIDIENSEIIHKYFEYDSYDSHSMAYHWVEIYEIYNEKKVIYI